jgi:hypothetical protein
LSLIVGGNKPHYDIVGVPRLRSIELMKAASKNTQKLIISEEVYLALRPRHFDFDDEHPIQVSQNLIGYGFRQANPSMITSEYQNHQLPSTSNSKPPNNHSDFGAHKDTGSSAESTDMDDIDPNMRVIQETTRSTALNTSIKYSKPSDLHSLSFFAPNKEESRSNFSPKNSMFNSMNSSISSELYSIDLSVETDSEMEWVTPEMLVYDRMQKRSGATSLLENQRTSYKGDHAKQYSDFSEAENIRGASMSSRFRRKRYF